jgi:heat shock protein HtpX
MTVDFWEAQRKARKRTKVYIFVFLLMTFLMAAFTELAMHTLAQDSYNPSFPFMGMFFVVTTFLVAGWQYWMYRTYGGEYVAESVGGIKIDPRTNNPYEKQLLNIVQEIALASSLPIPSVYILPVDQINAFAAGMTSDKAAIAITQGTLKKLNRDEVQGVIAHEFGHIYNKDMKITLQLAAMVMGFFFILYLALRILQFSSYRRSDGDNQRGANPILVAALVLIVVGTMTWFFGSILKASVSREREYLADACAVQFTRNPAGISNALRKIALDTQVDEMPKEGTSISHLYLDDRGGLSSIFATHPPLKKRIEAIEGRTYIPEEWEIPKRQ